MWLKLIQHNHKWNINGKPFDPYSINHQEVILTPDYDYNLDDNELCRKTYVQLLALDCFYEELAKCRPHPEF